MFSFKLSFSLTRCYSSVANRDIGKHLVDFNKALPTVLNAKERRELDTRLKHLDISTHEYAIRGVEFLSSCSNILKRLNIHEGTIGDDHHNLWMQRKDSLITKPMLPIPPGQFRTDTALKISMTIKRLHDARPMPLSIIEIGSLACRDLIATSMSLMRDSVNVTNVRGVDLHKQACIAARCAQKAFTSVPTLEIQLSDMTIMENFSPFELSLNKHFILNRVLSAIPYDSAVKILKNTAQAMAQEDIAFVNLTILDAHAESIMNRIHHRKNLKFKIHDQTSHIEIYGSNGLKQNIFRENYAIDLLQTTGFSIADRLEINEYRSRHNQAGNFIDSEYCDDTYVRSLYFLVKKNPANYYLRLEKTNGDSYA